jgi:hypothetical protein
MRADGLSALPPPVARYFRRVLTPDQAPIIGARFIQSGALRTAPDSKRWLSFRARQAVSPRERAFKWDAKVKIAPLLHVRVLDSYAEGIGAGEVHLLSALRIAGLRGDPEMNSGALHRYLAEAVWYPTAWLPQAGVLWSAIDQNRATVALTDRGTTVSLEVRFNSLGEAVAIYSPNRWGRFAGTYRQAAWEGHFAAYENRGGLVVPSEGEVGWYSEGEWRAVWKGRIIEASYEWSP